MCRGVKRVVIQMDVVKGDVFVFVLCSHHHRDLHSFPTRRSSDLPESFDRSRERRRAGRPPERDLRSEEHTSELQYPSISYAVFCLKKKIAHNGIQQPGQYHDTQPPPLAVKPLCSVCYNPRIQPDT